MMFKVVYVWFLSVGDMCSKFSDFSETFHIDLPSQIIFKYW